MRAFVYADNTTIFIKPTRQDIDMLVDILKKFNIFSRLKTNFQKSTIVSIRCMGVDLDDVLQDLLVAKMTLPSYIPGVVSIQHTAKTRGLSTFH